MASRWVIFYDDGSMFSSDAGAWEDAPSRGVQAVIFEDRKAGWAVRHGGDFFILDDDGMSVNLMGCDALIDHVADVLGVVKVGRMLSSERFADVYQQAKRVRDSLKQHGWPCSEVGAD